MPSPILPVSNPATAARSKHKGIGDDEGVKALIDDSTDRLLASSRFDDEKVSSVRPLLSRSSSYNSVNPTAASGGGYGQHHQQRRRKVGSDGSLPSLVGSVRAGFVHEVEDGCPENRSAGWFSLKLLKYLG